MRKAMFLLALTFLSTSAIAQNVRTYPGYGISVSLYYPTSTNFHGYTEYRVEIQNSSEDPHEVTISLPQRKYSSRSTQIQDIRRSVTVQAKQRATMSLFQPEFPSPNGNGILVTIDGDDQDRGFNASFGWTRSRAAIGKAGRGRRMSVEYLALYSAGAQDIHGRREEVIERDRRQKGFWNARLDGIELARAGFPVTEWSEHWLGYTRYDAIILTARELQSMKASVRTAMWLYAESGGTLVIFGKTKVPSGWKPLNQPAPGGEISQRYDTGFGTCFISDEETVTASWIDRNWDDFFQSCTQTSTPWRQIQTLMDANDAFEVVEDLGIPVKGLFVLMILFGLIIGPVNFSMLRRANKRIWMLWTVPVISFAMCLAVLLFMFIIEGWERSVRTETITVLNQPEKRASTIGWTAFYAPILPGEGLQFSYSSELVLQDMRYRGRRRRTPGGTFGGSNRACVIDWTDQQHYVRGWLEPRVPSQFQIRKAEARTERVNVYRRGQSLSMTNLLGTEIENFMVMDEEGRIFTKSNIEAGAVATLNPKPGAGKPVNHRGFELRGIYSQTTFHQGQRLFASNPEQFLRRKTYIAELKSSPFCESGIPDASNKRFHCWVYGILGEIKDQ